MRSIAAVLALLLLAIPSSAQESPSDRISSDFELATIEKQIATTRDAASLSAAWLNMGDVRSTRRESTRATAAYQTSLEVAQKERREARLASQLTRYAQATARAGLAASRLSDHAAAFDLFEESLRYLSDAPSTWNLLASAMLSSGHPPRAVAAAKNAVSIASAASDESAAGRLDLNVYRYTLASSLAADQKQQEAVPLLEKIVDDLQSTRFDDLREEISRNEVFEVKSSVRSDAEAFVSLSNRSSLRLARLYEDSGQLDRARSQYEKVIARRTDDAIALTALARLSGTLQARRARFLESFEANPFALPLMIDYENFAKSNQPLAAAGDTTASQVIAVINALVAQNPPAAASAMQQLERRHASNDSVTYLSARLAEARGDSAKADEISSRLPSSSDHRADLRLRFNSRSDATVPPVFLRQGATTTTASSIELAALVKSLRSGKLDPEARQGIDTLIVKADVEIEETVRADAETTDIEMVKSGATVLKFPQATRFTGDFSGRRRAILSFRILGLTTVPSGEALLVEPVLLEKR